ncbi:NRDE-2, necessary for RNA interference-domain-containing protein [Multifurca ochricompacta]|uniref:NRDE-2, necessary for RNA interference-domain-containing protein n=1 Tax=Multifurca ochricompacta TaxID=376703 RepID=A0AAD4MDK1_9AGAM|nr:NRDE-2, necessary for RNA interference-domain-containing protein [Multifurca ochricompacta]
MKILGLTHAWTVAHRSNRGVEVALGGGRQKLLGLSDTGSWRLLESAPRRRLVASADAGRKDQETNGFIPLPSYRPRPAKEEDLRRINTSNDRDSETDSPSVSAGSDNLDDDDQDGTAFPSYHEKMRSLEKQLSKDPSSASTWLSLLSHSLAQVPTASKNATKVRSEITLSILDRALQVLPKSPSSTRIRLLYLHAGEELWTDDTLRQEWEKALAAGDIDVLLAWLDWRIRNGSGGLNGTVEAITRVFAFAASESDRLRIFWRLVCALRQAGFTERSMALFQAQADLANFHNQPAITLLPLEEQINNLEEFWESEAPRIGEPGSTGWANWHKAGKPGLALEGVLSSKRAAAGVVIPSPLDPYQLWAREETREDDLLKPPSRSTDPDAELDPYTAILFSDIRPFLFSLTSRRSKGLFRLMWLSYLGLHVPGLETMAGASDDDRWTQLHLVSKSYMEAIFPSSSDRQVSAPESHAGVLVGRETHYADSFGPIKSWSYRCIGPLEIFELQNQTPRWGLWTKEDLVGVDVEFVRRVFEQSRMGGDDVEWDLLTLTFEAAIDVKGALKKSRSFLASAPESLPHWAAHARLERFRGRLEEARKVYETVLSSPASSRNRLSAGPLWWDWAEMEWLTGHFEATTGVVLRAAEVEGFGGLAILRGKRALEATADEIPETLWKVREAWTRLGALLELLTGDSLPSFLTAPLVAGTVTQESMTMASVGMLYHHIFTLRSPIRPAILRERLEKAVELFPNNTILLGMFLEMQKGQGLWGRVRMLRDVSISSDITQEKGVSRRATEVWLGQWEKGQWSSEVERIRGGLTSAIESERTRGSPILWRLLLELEIRVGDLERAKSVILQALGECPLVKDIYMQAFDRLRPAFSAHELKSLWETMVERGLRIRKGLDEVIEGWEDVEGGTVEREEEMEGMDEIEYNSRELARLKPY